MTARARRAAMFVLVSGSGTAVNLAVFALLDHVVGLPPLVCSAIAFLVACRHNVTWHAQLTFRAGGEAAQSRRIRYVVLSTATLSINLCVLNALARAGVTPVLAQAAGILSACPINFLGSRRWVFASGSPARPVLGPARSDAP